MACAEHVDIQLRTPVESHLQSSSESAENMVSMTTNALPTAEDPVYAELQRQMHDALRAQHPEWVRPTGESPICDSYDSRLAELLRILPRAPGDKKNPPPVGSKNPSPRSDGPVATTRTAISDGTSDARPACATREAFSLNYTGKQTRALNPTTRAPVRLISPAAGQPGEGADRAEVQLRTEQVESLGTFAARSIQLFLF